MTIQTTWKRYGNGKNEPIQEKDQNVSLTSLQKNAQKEREE